MEKDLKELLDFERSQYFEKFSLTGIGYHKAIFFKESFAAIIKWQQYARKCDFYARRSGVINKLRAQWYRYWRNVYALKLDLEISTKNIGKGFLLYHSGGIIINADAVLGENVHLHGANCIGNAGENNKGCPHIGNNVTVGVGAKIIGDVTIADGVIIGAGAVVVESCLIPNAVLVGVPAKRIK